MGLFLQMEISFITTWFFFFLLEVPGDPCCLPRARSTAISCLISESSLSSVGQETDRCWNLLGKLSNSSKQSKSSLWSHLKSCTRTVKRLIISLRPDGYLMLWRQTATFSFLLCRTTVHVEQDTGSRRKNVLQFPHLFLGGQCDNNMAFATGCQHKALDSDQQNPILS